MISESIDSVHRDIKFKYFDGIFSHLLLPHIHEINFESAVISRHFIIPNYSSRNKCLSGNSRRAYKTPSSTHMINEMKVKKYH